MTASEWREWRKTTSVLSPSFADDIIADLAACEQARDLADASLPLMPTSKRTVTATVRQPNIDFVGGLSEAEHERLGPVPPAKRWYRCKSCNKVLTESEIFLNAKGEMAHREECCNTCGPVEEEKA